MRYAVIAAVATVFVAATLGFHSAGADECGPGGCGGKHGVPHGGIMGMMPQTNYDPPYGCYPGSRYQHRYPAFHGTYYRRPYNYRNYFDYPWHAELHEPTSHFSYNTENGHADSPAAEHAQPLPVVPIRKVPAAPSRSVEENASLPPVVAPSQVKKASIAKPFAGLGPSENVSGNPIRTMRR